MQLTFSEFELLQALMERPGQLFNREELLRAIWGDSAYRDPRGIDVHVRHLREKLERRPEPPAAAASPCAAWATACKAQPDPNTSPTGRHARASRIVA